MSRPTTIASTRSDRRYQDKVPGWYDPADPETVARYRDLIAAREEARAAGVPVVWWRPFQTLVTYVNEHGRLPAKDTILDDGYFLGRWVQAQRTAARKHMLSAEQRGLLEQVAGWEWERLTGTHPDADLWETRRRELLAFLEAHGSYPTAKTSRVLYDWVRLQQAKAHRVAPDRVPVLEAIPGWSFNESLSGRAI